MHGVIEGKVKILREIDHTVRIRKMAVGRSGEAIEGDNVRRNRRMRRMRVKANIHVNADDAIHVLWNISQDTFRTRTFIEEGTMISPSRLNKRMRRDTKNSYNGPYGLMGKPLVFDGIHIGGSH